MPLDSPTRFSYVVEYVDAQTQKKNRSVYRYPNEAAAKADAARGIYGKQWTLVTDPRAPFASAPTSVVPLMDGGRAQQRKEEQILRQYRKHVRQWVQTALRR